MFSVTIEPTAALPRATGISPDRPRRGRAWLATGLVVAGIALSGCGSDTAADDAGEASNATLVSDDTVEAPLTTDTADIEDTIAGTVPTEPSTPATAPTSASDPCDVLAGVDLEALVGEPVTEPNGSDDLMGASCRVDPVSDSHAGLRVVVSDQEAADNFENQREVLGVDTEAAGIGDKAFHTGPYLIVLDGDRLVLIQVVRDSAEGFGVPDADLEAAAQTILANLN